MKKQIVKKSFERIFEVIVIPVALLGLFAFAPCVTSFVYAEDLPCVEETHECEGLDSDEAQDEETYKWGRVDLDEVQDEETHECEGANSDEAQDDLIFEINSLNSKFVWGDKVFSPYVQLSSGNKININDVYAKTGQKYYTFAFMNNNNGIPAWRGKYNYNSGLYDEEIDKLRRNGGNIIISFGGANTKEMAPAIKDVNKLQAAYQSVIDYYDLTWIDLDIEGEILKDKAANTRRNKALVGLQKKRPKVVYSYCLPADPRGLSSKAVALLKDAKEQGVRVDVVNVMAMDYGDSIAPNPEGKMGYYAIKTAEETKKQLEKIGYKDTKVGVTVMIGMNDVKSEIFRIKDAKELLAWANKTSWVRYLGFWSVNRDNGNGSGAKEANGKHSSISQSLYEFTNVFKAFKKDGTMSNFTASTNLALKKNVTCSSVEEGTDLVAKNVVDGDMETRWASEEKKNNPEWIQVDLGKKMIINKVDIRWEAAYAKDFKIEVSTDGNTYKTVATVDNNTSTSTSNTFASVDARYVRVYCTKKATEYGYSIFDIGVYNTRQTPENTNLALKKPVICSSVEEGTDLVAQNAVDGTRKTRWASEEKKNNPEWIQVDLGSVMTINQVDINWEAAYAKEFKIEVSTDGKTYKTVATVKDNTKTDTYTEFDVVDARYVRVYCTEKATEYGYSIYELGVFNVQR
ncbi:MAG: discoidin domain-containing protein [Clostridiales bacterium]|nr:discoidin domain-containing protein [Clostridiales bacterium]